MAMIFSSGYCGKDSCGKCHGHGILTKWLCGYLQPYPMPWEATLCPVHGGCLQNDRGESMKMIRCDCSHGLTADLEQFKCTGCGEYACSTHYKDNGVTGKKCFACENFEVSKI